MDMRKLIPVSAVVIVVLRRVRPGDDPARHHEADQFLALARTRPGADLATSSPHHARRPATRCGYDERVSDRDRARRRRRGSDRRGRAGAIGERGVPRSRRVRRSAGDRPAPRTPSRSGGPRPDASRHGRPRGLQGDPAHVVDARADADGEDRGGGQGRRLRGRRRRLPHEAVQPPGADRAREGDPATDRADARRGLGRADRPRRPGGRSRAGGVSPWTAARSS